MAYLRSHKNHDKAKEQNHYKKPCFFQRQELQPNMFHQDEIREQLRPKFQLF